MSEYENDQHWKNRIEQKIDTLQESMILLARAEEKLIAIEDDRKEIWKKLNKLSEKLENIEALSHDSAKSVSVISKVFWIALTTLSGVYAAQYFI